MPPTVFLTGDVHQRSANNPDQAYVDGTELEVALSCARIARQQGVDLTLFCTGASLVEDRETAADLAALDGVEIGGHTWNAFAREWLHYAFRATVGSFYGPAVYQRRDVRRTLAAVEDVTGAPARSWRGHAFSGGERTERILRETPVAVVSNEVGPDREARDVDGLFSLPVNTRPDHDHVYHADRTERRLRREGRIRDDGVRGFLALDRPRSRGEWRRLALELGKTALGIETASTDYGREVTDPETWFDRLRADVDRRLDERGFATIVAHPACMAAIDDLELFERLCAWLSDRETALAHEAPAILG